MELNVFHTNGKPTGEKIELADAVFNIEPNDHAIWQDVVLIQANQRQGTHKVKERGEVDGSTKKPYKQKGTGNARQGHKRSPLHRHGGTIFGPRPKESYGFKVNKKVKTLARISALTYKARENKITVVEGVRFEKPQTKVFAGMLGNFDLTGRKVLFVLPPLNKPTVETENGKKVDTSAIQIYNQLVANVELSGRNLPKVNVAHAHELNTYDILNADQVVVVKEAISVINQLA